MAEQLAEERDDLGTGDVAHVEIEVQPEAVATQGHVAAQSREAVHIDDAARQPPPQVRWTAYFLASRIRLNGVSVARRNRVKPASANTRASRVSPAWAPSARPTSCEREFGVHTMVDAA
jgi:hypothetical protein